MILSSLLCLALFSNEFPHIGIDEYAGIHAGENTYNNRQCKVAHAGNTENAQSTDGKERGERTEQCACYRLLYACYNNKLARVGFGIVFFVVFAYTVKYNNGIIDGIANNRQHGSNKCAVKLNLNDGHNGKRNEYIMNKADYRCNTEGPLKAQ